MVYYKTIEQTHRCLYDNGDFETLKYLPSTTECHNFHLFKGYEASKEGILKYVNDFRNWNTQLKEIKIIVIYNAFGNTHPKITKK